MCNDEGRSLMKGLSKTSNDKTKKAKTKTGQCQNVPVESPRGVESQVFGPTCGRAHVNNNQPFYSCNAYAHAKGTFANSDENRIKHSLTG